MKTPVYLNQRELADRWRLSPRTLEGWRSRKVGPDFYKTSGRVTYALEDVLAFERRRRSEIDNGILGAWR
jgi:hypothetical protein